MRCRLFPEIFQGAIGPINQIVTEDVTVIQYILGLCQMFLPKASVTDAACSGARSGAHIFRNPRKISRTGRDDSTSRDINTVVVTVRLNTPIPSSDITSISPVKTGTQEIISPRRSITAKKARKAEPLDLPINGFSAINEHSTPIFSKVIGH